jgi:hypothetical protein
VISLSRRLNHPGKGWHTSVKRSFINGLKRGIAPFQNSLPSPLTKGRGIQGEGLVNNLSIRVFEDFDYVVADGATCSLAPEKVMPVME